MIKHVRLKPLHLPVFELYPVRGCIDNHIKMYIAGKLPGTQQQCKQVFVFAILYIG